MVMRTVLAVVGLVLSAGALLLTLLTVVPAPFYWVWRLSVGAIELSLWFGMAGLVGALLGVVAFRSGSTTVGIVALVCGLLALILGVIPPMRARASALREGVALSLSRYFIGAPRPGTPVQVTRDVAFAELDGQVLHLDVYRPAQAQAGMVAAMPAIIVIHGGSWSGGAKGEFPALTHALAGQGYAVFDVEYRLVGAGRRFPMQVGDVKCAIGWVKRHAATYGVAPERIALLGRSAGGQLALLAAYTADNAALPPSCSEEDSSVRAVIAYYAPVNLTWGYNNPARPDVIDGPATLRRYLGGTPAGMPETYRLASPDLHVGPASPPTLVLHGAHDRLVGVRHARFLREALERADVPHRVVVLPWADHGFDFFFDGWGSQITQPIMRDFLQTHLRER